MPLTNCRSDTKQNLDYHIEYLILKRYLLVHSAGVVIVGEVWGVMSKFYIEFNQVEINTYCTKAHI